MRWRGEQETVREPRRDMTEERALALSKKVASLHKGDIVRIVHYEDGAYRTLIGAIAEIDETFRSLTGREAAHHLRRRPLHRAATISPHPGT